MIPYPRKQILSLLLGLSCGIALQAETYYRVPLADMGYTEGRIDELEVPISHAATTREQAIQFPELQFDDAQVEAYIVFPETDGGDRNWWRRENQGQLDAVLRLPEDTPVKGKAKLARSGRPLKVAYAFKFDPGRFEPVTAGDFDTARQAHYARLAYAPIPGGDWFRYLAGDAYLDSGQAQRRRNLGSFDSSFNMFTGQRAVSENLALDRELILGTSKEGGPIDVSTIAGVTVSPVDWSERLTDSPTPIDPLASVIPHDQHAAFFNSIKDLNQVIRLAEEDAVGYFQTMSNRNVYQGLAKKYQKQMGILIPDILAEQLPVKSVAITGGDPFLPSGSDLCVIFETETPDALMAALNAMIQAQAKINGGNISTENSMNQDSTQYSYRNADRSFSANISQGENFVAVSNSRHQIHRMTDTANGGVPSLGSTEEFKFFRQRYPLEDAATAFIFLSDAAIRRWASPAFRIGASRRVRAAAVLGQATAQALDGAPVAESYTELTGELHSEGDSIRSERFNTLDFLTPISELEIETVTVAERQGYERWRRGYESGWVRFDPIALSLEIDETSLGMDLSVIPLRIGTRYNQWLEIAGDAKLDQVAITPHPESILMLSYAIDGSSEMFRMANRQSSAMLPGVGTSPLAWVGGSLSVFLDADPFWEAMHTAEDPEEYLEDHIAKLPVGLRVSSKSPIKLALFLTTLKSFSEQAAPGLLLWETREYEETPYVVIKTTERAGLPGDMEIKIHYAALPDAFLLSLNEDVLKRAISRNLNQRDAEEQEPGGAYQAFAQTKVNTLQAYRELMDHKPLREQQSVSWAALPILNEWHERFPRSDPVQIHARSFGEQIRCPGGQGYRWNPEIGGMESVAFGSPEAPRGDLQTMPLFEKWDEAKVAVSLENNELRVQAEANR